MVVLLRKKHLLTGLVCAVLCAALVVPAGRRALPAAGTVTPPGRVVIVDAGHGGADGGAVSQDGVAESGVNLAIALRLGQVLTFCGHSVVLTRDGEDSLCDDPAASLRQQKVSDTQNRVALVNGCPDGRLISIHQNTLPGHPGVHGAQSFYNGQGDAEDMARCIQQTLNCVANDREKDAKRMDASIYLMKHASCPAVLVECGFLSNPEETARLRQPEYQLHLATAIAAGFGQYCTNEGWK